LVATGETQVVVVDRSQEHRVVGVGADRCGQRKETAPTAANSSGLIITLPSNKRRSE
jgi:hypothetical protein